MKNIFLVALLCLYGTIAAQTKTEKINRTVSFENPGAENTLLVANINGSITVEGYAGKDLVIEVEKIINGKTQERLDKGVSEIDLGLIDRADTIILFIKGVTPEFSRSKENYSVDTGGWGYHWNNVQHEEKVYDYKMNFRIKVPSNVNIAISTINEGEVSISNLTSKVIANNINGGIKLDGVSNSVRAHTINGDLTINYVKNPVSDCRFYTLNGNINANFRKGLASRVSFKSFNGDFYTNVPALESLPIEVAKSKTDKGTQYKIDGNQYRVGSGGPRLDFETFNGNVYLVEK
jgi:DUF4097 and DUF4098 domain-containing protein YvlB